MNTPKTRCWAPEEMYQFEEVSKTWTHQSFSLSQKPQKIILSWLILRSDPLEAHIAWFRPITDTCQRLQVRKCDILKRSEAQSTFSWLLSEEKLPFACINKNVYTDGQVCVSEWQLLSHHTWQVNSQSEWETSMLYVYPSLSMAINGGNLNPNTSLFTNHRTLKKSWSQKQGEANQYKHE